MQIGVPKEIKVMEGRVALVPDACGELIRAGHGVAVQAGAGLQAGYGDQAYQASGCQICADAESLFRGSQLIIKVKEPIEEDLQYLSADHILFSYLHLAANSQLLGALKAVGLTAVAFETVADAAGQLPMLAPMSEIAGKLSIHSGGHLLTSPAGGRGVMLGGVGGSERGHVVIVGGGHAGGSAARLAASIGARVTVFDISPGRLAVLRDIGPNVTTLYPHPHSLAREIRGADLLVGAVLVPGHKAPHVVDNEMVDLMEPGSVVIDIAVDQGGCIESTKPTDYRSPSYIRNGVLHSNVTNMPGAVPRTASQALSAAVLPFAKRLADSGTDATAWPEMLRNGVNVMSGKAVYPGL